MATYWVTITPQWEIAEVEWKDEVDWWGQQLFETGDHGPHLYDVADMDAEDMAHLRQRSEDFDFVLPATDELGAFAKVQTWLDEHRQTGS